MIALQLPAPLGKLLVQYVSLFRPLQRQLSMDRLATLLGELLPMITEAKVERNRTVYPAPHEYWRQGMEDMLAKRDSLTLPLKSHGYLITIIAGFADKAQAKVETAGEQGRKYGEIKHASLATPITTAPAKKDKKPRVMPDAARSAISHFTERKNLDGKAG